MKTRLFVSGTLGNGSRLTLGAEQARYLGRVLRCRSGDKIRVFNGDDGEWSATIDTLGRSEASLTVDEALETTTESPLMIELVQGISRGERMDFVVQKATELGVHRITPVLTDHGVVKLDATRADKRRDHWRKVAESACEQSGRTRPPDIGTPVSLNDWFGARWKDAVDEFILHPSAADALAAAKAANGRIRLLIGPEGGFSDREYDDACVAGCRPVSLGPRTLRTETAAIAALTTVQLRWGDLG